MMKGSPPSKEFQVSLENWRKYPYTKWSFVNVRNLIPTAQIETGFSKEINFHINLTSFENLNIKNKDNFYKFYDVLKNDKKLLKHISIKELKNILEIQSKNKKIDWIFKNKIK